MLNQFSDSSRCHLNILSTHYIGSDPERIILVHRLPIDCTTQQGEIEGQKRWNSSIKNGGISLILDSTWICSTTSPRYAGSSADEGMEYNEDRPHDALRLTACLYT